MTLDEMTQALNERAKAKAEEVVKRFENVKQTAERRYTAKCPCHQDQYNSLHIEAKWGRVMLYCHAGCSMDAIMAAVGLKAEDLDYIPEPEKKTGELIAVEEPEAALSLRQDVAQLGTYLAQLGQMMATMQRRMDEMEAAQGRVTIRHAEVKRIQGLIRMRTEQLCGKYQLTDRDSARIIRAAIKKDLLKRYGVRDLHDIPESGMAGAESLVAGWTNIRLVMERRERA